MSSEPGLGGRRLTIRQQGDDPASFQVADDAGVSVIASPGPIINADDPERVSWRTATASDHAQERVFAHRQHQPFCEACRRSTAKRQSEVMDDRVQPRRASRRRSQYPFGETFSEDLTPAQDGIAAEAAGNHQEFYNPPRERQIGYAASIPAMDTSGNRSAAALGLLGVLDEARTAANAGLTLDPDFAIRRLRAVAKSSNNPAFLAGLERVCEGMRLAGVPEG
jgi:hypothetical protein